MKFAHISDLHLNSNFRQSNLKEIKKILGYCNDIGVNHLFITGDLTDDASENDLSLLKKTLDSFGFNNGTRLSVIPGNHDIFGGLQKPEDIFEFPERCRLTNYDSKIESFNNIFMKSFDNCIYENKKNKYPYAKIIGDVLVIGINSNLEYSKITNPFASNGLVKEDALSEMIKILDEFGKFVKYKIILIHHHFNKLESSKGFSTAGLWQNIEKQTMKLRKKKFLYPILTAYEIDLVLHGHLHITDSYIKKDILFLNAGGSVKVDTQNELKIHSINIDNKSIETEISTLRLKPYLKLINKVNTYNQSVKKIQPIITDILN